MSESSLAPAAAVDHFNPRTDLIPVIIVVAASTASDVSSVAFAACCSEVGAGNETGSGEDRSGDCVMDTNDSRAGGSVSGIAHTGGTGNSGYSHDAGRGAAMQPQEQIEEESRDLKSSFCEFRNKRVKCRNVEDLSRKQNEGQEWVKSHFMPWEEATFKWRRPKRWDQMTATRAGTHCQWVWVTISGLIAKTKQAAIAALMSTGIQAEDQKTWEGEAAMRKSIPDLRQAGYESISDLPKIQKSYREH